MNKDYEFYINHTLFDKQIDRMEHITERIIHVYCDNWVYIFNFASEGKKYIRTSCGEKEDWGKTKNY
jgi:hypothetical protein